MFMSQAPAPAPAQLVYNAHQIGNELIRKLELELKLEINQTSFYNTFSFTRVINH